MEFTVLNYFTCLDETKDHVHLLVKLECELWTLNKIHMHVQSHVNLKRATSRKILPCTGIIDMDFSVWLGISSVKMFSEYLIITNEYLPKIHSTI